MFNKRSFFLKRSKETVTEALKSRDMLLGAVTKTLSDLDQIINLLGERLEHWYGIYFPELRFEDKIKYAEAVLIVDRKNLDEKELSKLFGQKKVDELSPKAKTSLGADISDEDLGQCRVLANEIILLGKLRKSFEIYQKNLAIEICPNLSGLAGPEIAANLISHVGSLKRLSVLPASTLQVLGAERSLFKHLKNKKIPPPKHGLIFQHPKISTSPKVIRGKIARTLANKMALATKADAYTKNNLIKKLVEDFESRYKKIMEEYEKNKKNVKNKDTNTNEN